MNRNQFLLTKLAEECAEVSQRALKQIQYGAQQIQTGSEVKDGVAAPVEEAGLTNAQRLYKEVEDFAVIIDLLFDAGQLPDFIPNHNWVKTREKKIEKLNKYLAFSRKLGEIDGDWTI